MLPCKKTLLAALATFSLAAQAGTANLTDQPSTGSMVLAVLGLAWLLVRRTSDR